MATEESNLAPLSRPRRLAIELLALDLDSCKRCTGTDANVQSALDAVAALLRETGVEVELSKTVVKTAEQAESLRFESSPTVRINGQDIAVEHRESACGDCGELCGCAGGVNCRVWVWQGREYLEAPRAMVIDAVLRAAYERPDRPASAPGHPFRLPENLRQFFAASGGQTPKAAPDECCDKTSCCEPAAKPACCGTEPQPAGCGCR